jgi:hypothetical protein
MGFDQYRGQSCGESGAEVHLAEPAETAGLRGPKKRAKGDRADARHLRELLMVKRLPESWIPPDHILDLRARVRLRPTLSEQRSEWQQRIQATLYHHGCPQRRDLMVGDGREWLAAQPLPAAAREQVTVALGMIDGIEARSRRWGRGDGRQGRHRTSGFAQKRPSAGAARPRLHAAAQACNDDRLHMHAPPGQPGWRARPSARSER